jgi:two-component system response regulator
MNSFEELEILIVEDNLNDAELALRSLRKDYPNRSILHLQDGEEVLNYLFPKGSHAPETTNILPKIILLDLKLPKVDGFELLKIIKNHPGTQMIPIVILSSSAERKDIIQCYTLHANSYIVKPVDFDTYRDTISLLGLYWLSKNQNIPNESA